MALDDGSTDATGDLLRAAPIVARTLSNPRRDGYRGWDDAANRARLLEAVAELDPVWILSLDADERVDAGDGGALRRFVEQGPRPGNGYLLRVYRMIGDEMHFDQDPIWVGRLFSFEPGMRFSTEQFHFPALPVSIGRERWFRTTLRIQHLAGMTAAQREARHAKYLEVDPEQRYQPSYQGLLAPPGRVKAWQRRRPGLPVVIGPQEKRWRVWLRG